MEAAQIKSCLYALDAELAAEGVTGEVCLYGGAVMCLVYHARPDTKDVDAIFEPSSVIRRAAARIAEREGLRPDWLNDAVKGFLGGEHNRRILLELEHLKVFVPDADYMLAMKCLAARVDAMDRDDVKFLLKHLNIESPDRVFEIIRAYYPREQIKPATRFFIEELLS